VGLSTAVADECLGNMRTVRAFAMEEQEAKLFSRELEKSTHLNELLGMGIGIFQAGTNLFLNGVVLGTLYIGGNMLSTGVLKPGDLMSFLVCAQTIQKSLGQLSILWGTYVRGMSAGARVFEYINEIPTIPVKGGKKIPYYSLKGEIEFKNVTFAYPTRPFQKVLSDFNLHVPPGKVVAIVGISGSGKSTLAQLVERFYDVSEGSITVDDIDIRELDPSWVRGKLIGFINQEPILFAYIYYGKYSLRTSKCYRRGAGLNFLSKVIQAAKEANADEFISSFSQGYHTIVGERGVTVSGGQKQRIAIARALIKNPSVLILDEATSALDAESEAVVQEELEKCMKGRTTIIIAHRLSTIQNADLIAVLSNGKLAELGTHQSLKRKGGIYSDLIKQQQKENKKGSWIL
ncbi:ATP-binding cassette sub-family B member 8, mitochondrial, partial [Armadillidium nasatum]